MSTVVLITGANRGLGKGLLERYLKLPNHTVIVANRNPDHPTSKQLSELPTAEGTKLIVAKLDASVWQDAADAINTLESQGIDHFDIVIANAEANAYGVVSLYQAVQPLLQKSKKEPIYSIMGTTAGSLNNQPALTNAAYGPSESASAWFSISINEEDSWLHSFSLCPGWVHTDMGDAGAEGLGTPKVVRDQLMIGIDESCDGMMKVLAETTKAKHGGKLVAYHGKTMLW